MCIWIRHCDILDDISFFKVGFVFCFMKPHEQCSFDWFRSDNNCNERTEVLVGVAEDYIRHLGELYKGGQNFTFADVGRDFKPLARNLSSLVLG